MTDKTSQAQREHCEALLSPPEPDRQQRNTQTHAERGILTLLLQMRSYPLLRCTYFCPQKYTKADISFFFFEPTPANKINVIMWSYIMLSGRGLPAELIYLCNSTTTT